MSGLVDISGSVQSVVGRRPGFWGLDGHADILVVDKGFRTELQESDQDIYSSVSYGLVHARNAVAYTASFSPDPPSWTQDHIGTNQACVMTVLSSSRHEQQVLNCFLSGSEAFEVTAVPASGNVYYGKEDWFRTVTYRSTSSHPQGLVNDDKGSEVSQAVGTGTLVSSTASNAAPKKFFFSVNETGFIQNIRVWIEIVHGTGSGYEPPLKCLGIALRSPNVRWGASHPIHIDPSIAKRFPVTGFPNAELSYTVSPINDFYRDTFIIWEGYRAFTSGSEALLEGVYPTWNHDCDMRTVFEDGSPHANPRHIHAVGSSVWGNVVGSPNASGSLVGNAVGANVPWTTDVNSGLVGNANNRAPGSPPPGWLLGGSVAGPNEWPTTGSNIGAATIRPLYPFLDDVVVYKKDHGHDGLLDTNFPNWQNWRGFRPGLRNTQMSGTWEVHFITTLSGSFSTLAVPTPTFVRQVRLEFEYSNGLPPARDHYPRPSTPSRPGEAYKTYFSGSDGFDSDVFPDFGLNEMRTVVGGECAWGRSFGLSTNTASFQAGDTALFWRLSGALADIVGESPSWIIGFNGMPMIPSSTSSMVPASSQAFATGSSTNPLSVLNPRLRLGTDRLSAASARILPRLTLEEYAIQFSSGSG